MNGHIAKAAHVDVNVQRDSGGLFFFVPHTPVARTWIDIHVPEGTFYAGALVVEGRYAMDLARGMLSDGLKVE